MKLYRTGYYKEMMHGEVTDPSIKNYTKYEYCKAEKEAICKYLRSGVVMVACGGVVGDVLSKRGELAGCPDMITDGTWFWPGDFPYYVEKYDLQVEAEFMMHMKLNNYIINITAEDIDFDNLELCTLAQDE